MKRIAVEEHFSTQEHAEQFRLILARQYPVREVVEAEQQLHVEVRWLAASKYSTGNADILSGKILEVGEQRIKEMEEDGIDMQVLSLVAPGVQVFDAATGTSLSRKVNDQLYRIVQKYPRKFAGLASLAPQDPKGAADELERTVKDLGMKGASINSHTKGEYLDDKKYWMIFERAERLGVPIYLHPRMPSPDMAKPYLTYPALATAMNGFGAEVSLHALRLILSGLFDEHPGVKIILGHLGEALPFWLWRLDNRWARMPQGMTIKKKPSQYIKDNFFITTAGNFSVPAFLCAYLELGADRILFAVDYPLESNKEAVEFMDVLPISEGDKEKVCHLNAERLFKL
ncbi:MAG TPA: amidohydrolase family protein [Thermodesulfobacteriota bacterium]|nr:amidohydrolase family protein [Thermodesulfobacteriota bacterium]